MPLGEGEMIAPERLNTGASQGGSDEYGNDLFFMSGSCDDSGCCSICGANGCSGCDPWALFPNCTPPGMLQWMHAVHDSNKACWSTQVDAVLFWRDAPLSRELATSTPVGGSPVSALNADQLESELAGGPRIGIVRKDGCGNAAEFVYLRAFNFRSQRALPVVTGSEYAPASIFGKTSPTFAQGNVNLGSGFQTFEANSRVRMRPQALTFISGFRWLEWREAFTMDTTASGTTTNYSSSVVNSLYGGQIGIDALLLTTSWMRINSWLKGGAYYNNAVQHTSYQSTTPGETPFSRAVNGTPAAGSFVGEIGINGTMALSPCVNFRFGYNAYWLETIALATQQLSDPSVLSMNGNVVLQGINFGLEGNW